MVWVVGGMVATKNILSEIKNFLVVKKLFCFLVQQAVQRPGEADGCLHDGDQEEDNRGEKGA